MFLFRNRGNKPVVFVVDDEAQILELEEALLLGEGYNVRAFSNPEEALKEYRASAPDLVLTDYWMPRMSGMDLIRECRQINPGQKTILISGTVDGAVFADAVIKPNRFLSKPFQVDGFIKLVAEVLTASDGK